MVIDGYCRAICCVVFISRRLVNVVDVFCNIDVNHNGYTYVPLEMLAVYPS